MINKNPVYPDYKSSNQVDKYNTLIGNFFVYHEITRETVLIFIRFPLINIKQNCIFTPRRNILMNKTLTNNIPHSCFKSDS